MTHLYSPLVWSGSNTQRWVLRSLAALLASHGLAASLPATVVQAVNMPAWVQRDGVERPLEVGMPVRASDTLRTGAGARVLLALPEGSQVRLGEHALLRAEALDTRPAADGVFRASLNVVKGALRFTTSLLGQAKARDVRLQVSSVTAGIRGTDVWMKADDAQDVVCLVEGKVTVNRANETEQWLTEPLDFYIAPKGQPAQPVGKVSRSKLEGEWLPQVAEQAGQGLARAKGSWQLTVFAGKEQGEALGWRDTLRTAGYAARISPQAGYYRVQIARLASRADAEALGQRLRDELAVPLAQAGR